MIPWRHIVQFSILISLPKTFSPSTVNVRSKFRRIWTKKRTFRSLVFYWPFETKTAIFNFDNPVENFSCEHGNCSFEVLKNLKKKENFQKFDFLIDLMRRKLHFSILISLSENFLAKHSKCSFKVLKSLKKNKTFKKSVFNSKFSFGHVECSFKKQVENFPPRFKKSFSSSYVSCNTNISKRIHIDTRIAFLTNRVKTLLPQVQNNYVPSPK